MFGVIVAQLDCLSADEKARYQETYCGLCHSLKDRYGQLSRFCVNFDMAFLALLLESLNERGEQREEGSCILQIGKTHGFRRGPYIDYAADMSVVLAYHKCLDDWRDDASAAGLAYSKALTAAFKRIAAAHPTECAITEQRLATLRTREREAIGYADLLPSHEEQLSIADAIADDFGQIMSQMFAYDAGFWEDDMRELGYHLGRFVYFMDAAIDRDDDAAEGNYNPFETCETNDDDIDFILNDAIGCAARVFERLPLENDLHLLRSVLYAGVWQKLLAKRHEEDDSTPEHEASTEDYDANTL